MSRHLIVLGLITISLALLVPAVCRAQSIPNQVGPQNATGTQAYDPYGGTRENINLGNGNLNLQIPLISLPGRNGHNLSLALRYDSKIWNPHSEFDPDTGQTFYYWDFNDPGDGAAAGWGFNIPVLMSSPIQPYTTNPNYHCQGAFILITGDGSKHAFYPTTLGSGVRTACYFVNSQGQIIQEPQLDIPIASAYDSSFFLLDTSNASDFVVRAKDGTTIHFPVASGSALASKIEDTNGNIITIPGIQQVTDSLGRIVSFSSGGSSTQISYKDSAGTPRTITLSFTTQTLTPTFSLPAGSNPGSFPSSMLTSITLPNNLSWTFQYNTYGELTKITYPTGGYARYDYAAFSSWVQVLPNTSGNPSFAADFREVTAKYLCRLATGSCSPSTTPEDVTTYTPTVDATKTNNQYMDVVSPLGDRTRHQFSYLTSTSGFSNFYSMRELFRYHYQGQNTLLRTVQTDYTQESNGITTNASLPIRETTSLNDVSPALMTKTEWDYSGVADDVSEKREYAFGSGAVGALVRTTDYTWLAVNPINSQDYTSNAIHILNRKASEQVKDSGGNMFAQTQYEYDNYASDQKHAPLLPSGAVQHDSAFGTSYTIRGVLTSSSHWRNTDGTWLATYNQFDDAGNLLKTIDPGTHTTSFGYSDSWNDATCSPTGGSAAAYRTSATNALSQTATSKFNSCSGTIASTTDLNGQIVSSTYDLMGRMTQTNFPDGGQTNRTFNESTLPRGISATTKITSASNGVGTANVDGLGRVVQPQLNSDPQGVVYTDTTFDALERKSTVSNPYRSTSESTYGITTYQYDALSRITKVIPPDGSSSANNVSTTYSGNCSTATDQAGKKRMVCSDGLGRMTQVFEPNSSGSFVNETDYQYDVLNNLLCVHQRGTDTTADKACTDGTVPATWRPRTFTYNSLSQLLTTTNPESGTITYTYDVDGNVLTKLDARGITTTFYYDALHRLTKKTFSDTTPQVTYWYDGQTVTGCSPTLTATYPIGRRTAMCDAAGWEAWSFDVMGRVLTERRSTNAVIKTTSYTYNLDGSLATATYPTGRTITYTTNAAGHPVSAVDTANSINYATNASYGAYGAMTSMKNGASVYSTFLFNTRLQPCWLYVTTTSSGAPTTCTQTGVATGAVQDFKYDFGFGVSDNGNVNGLINNRNTARTQTFTFDELNRLKTALTQATTGSQCFGLDYSYDIWGNLTATTLDSARPSCSWTILTNGISSLNRLTNTGFSYDSAGNVLTDGSFTYIWDAESQLKTAAGVTYTYDGDGRRVQKSNGKLYWYGATGDILDETDASGNLTNEYVYFAGKRIARRDPSSNVYYYFADHLGSSRVITQANGTVCYDADYDPFGKEVVVTNTCPQNYKFNGKERDTETNLDDFGARYYSSQFGRWTSPDWSGAPSTVPYAELINPQSFNLYAYVHNNPVTLADLDGHMIAQDTMNKGAGDLGGQGHWSPTTGPNLGEDNAAPEFGTINNEQNTDASSQPSAENSGDSADPNPSADPQAQQQSAQTPAAQPQNQNQDQTQANQPPAPDKPPSWDPKKPLPGDPTKLGPDWKPDPQHDPGGKSGDERYVNPSGDKVDWHKGVPGGKGWDGKDHWHWVPGGKKEKWHYQPGDKVKSTAVKVAIVTAVVVYVIVSEGSRLFPPRNLVPVW
jgi:RHS repeat-associated protein